MSSTLNFALIQDVILLLISSIACFYCYLLNKRLKGLSDLKTGVGASIVSLTKAIKDTGSASQSAKQSTKGSVDTLEGLIAKAESASVKMEAELISLQRHIKATIKLNNQLNQKVEQDLPQAIEKAQVVASNLLNVVSGATDYNSLLTVDSKKKAAYAPSENESIKSGKAHLSVVETQKRSSNSNSPVEQTLQATKATPENIMAPPIPANIERDEIDGLFDDIDALVQSKGVSKKIGFLETKEYYKS